MADFIRTAIERVKQQLEHTTPELLTAAGVTPFRKFGYVFTGVSPNPPELWVEPRRTQFDPEGQLQNQQHELVIKLAVMGSSPEQIAEAALVYVKACDDALSTIQFDQTMLRVFIAEHDYGPLYSLGGGFARFPELHVVVETIEW